MVKQQGVPSVNWSRTYFSSHRPARGAGATTIKADLEPLSGRLVFGYARWRMDWVNVSSELAQGRRAWSAYIRDEVNSIGDAGSTRPE